MTLFHPGGATRHGTYSAQQAKGQCFYMAGKPQEDRQLRPDRQAVRAETGSDSRLPSCYSVVKHLQTEVEAYILSMQFVMS